MFGLDSGLKINEYIQTEGNVSDSSSSKNEAPGKDKHPRGEDRKKVTIW